MDEPIEFAWHVHDALKDWTGKVDTKASIAVALDTAVAGLLLAASRQGGPLYALMGWRFACLLTGIALLLAAAVLAMYVVVPHLKRRTNRKWRDGIIYFGHLRKWNVEDLVARLEQPQADNLRELAQQHIVMSGIAWRKHAALQGSLLLLVVAVCLFIMAAI